MEKNKKKPGSGVEGVVTSLPAGYFSSYTVVSVLCRQRSLRHARSRDVHTGAAGSALVQRTASWAGERDDRTYASRRAAKQAGDDLQMVHKTRNSFSGVHQTFCGDAPHQARVGGGGRLRQEKGTSQRNIMEEGGACRLPLASLPDGALAHVLSFGEVPDLVVANNVRESSLPKPIHHLTCRVVSRSPLCWLIQLGIGISSGPVKRSPERAG